MKAAFAAALAAVILALAACSAAPAPNTSPQGSTQSVSPSSTSAAPAAAKTADEMASGIADALGLDELVAGSDKWLAQAYGKLDMDTVTDWTARINGSSINTDEILVVVFDSDASAQNAMAAIDAHIARIEDAYENYVPEEYQKALGYKTRLHGDTLLFVIAGDTQTALSTFDSFFS